MPWIDNEKYMDMMDGLHERDILAERVKDMGRQIKFWQDSAVSWRQYYLAALGNYPYMGFNIPGWDLL